MKDKLILNESFDEDTLEGQGWEYVASKDIYDEDGFRDVYYWYKKDGNNRFYFSSDVDYGDPEYYDWETEGEEAAQEWFDSYRGSGEESELDEGISGSVDLKADLKKAINALEEKDAMDIIHSNKDLLRMYREEARKNPDASLSYILSQLDGLVGSKLKTEGVSGGMTVEDIAKKHNVPVEDIKAQVEKGIKVEKEHTDDEKKAERVALDHLFELPDYYDRLDKMEKGALKEETEGSRTKKASNLQKGDVVISTEQNDWLEEGEATVLEAKKVWDKDHNSLIEMDISVVYSDDSTTDRWALDPHSLVKIKTSSDNESLEEDIDEEGCTLEDIAARVVVNGPAYRGARMPEPRQDAINESAFADEMRAKYYDARVKDDVIEFTYITQEPFTEEDAEVFRKEVDRFFNYIIEVSCYDKPVKVSIDVVCRDGNEAGHASFDLTYQDDDSSSIQEDTVKQNGKWVNKGDTGETHGKFRTKKAADAQRKAMFANGFEESFNPNSNDYTLTTVGDMIDGLVGNMSDDEIDSDLRRWRKVSKQFNFRPNVDNIAVLIIDEGYDPADYFPFWAGEPRRIKNTDLVYYDVPFFCVKEVKNGRTFLYFDSEDCAKNYINLIDSGIDLEDDQAYTEWADKHPRIHESLKRYLDPKGIQFSYFLENYYIVKVLEDDGEWTDWGLIPRKTESGEELADYRKDLLKEYKDVKFYTMNNDGYITGELKEAVKAGKGFETVYSWYKKTYPDDYQVEDIDKEVTFDRLRNALSQNSDIGSLLGKNLDNQVFDRVAAEVKRRFENNLKESLTYSQLLDRMNSNVAETALGRMMDQVEEETGEWPDWDDEAPEWVIKNCLGESLKEDIDTEIVADTTDTFVADHLIEAIKDEWQTISLYNNILATLFTESTEDDKYKDIIPVIQDIVEEENVHVGQLQKALETISPDTAKIQSGEVEADGQLEKGEEESIGEIENAVVESKQKVNESWDDEYDDFELAGIYGGDMTYCPICGKRLEYTEDGDQYCPKCEESAWALAQERRKLDKERSKEYFDSELGEALNPDDDVSEMVEGWSPNEWAVKGEDPLELALEAPGEFDDEYPTDSIDDEYPTDSKPRSARRRAMKRIPVNVEKEPVGNRLKEDTSGPNTEYLTQALADGTLDKDTFIDYMLTHTPDEMLSGIVEVAQESGNAIEGDQASLDDLDTTDIDIPEPASEEPASGDDLVSAEITIPAEESKQKLPEVGPLATAVISAVAPVVADKVIDKILPEEAVSTEDDLDESALTSI